MDPTPISAPARRKLALSRKMNSANNLQFVRDEEFFEPLCEVLIFWPDPLTASTFLEPNRLQEDA